MDPVPPTPEYLLDCRDLPCPQPVIRIRNLLESSPPERLAVIVDNEPALENVNRFLASRGYAVSRAKEGDLWRVSASRASGADRPVPAPETRRHPESEQTKTLVMIIAPVFGSGDDALGAKLMKNFLGSLPELGGSLWRLVLLNGGVTLAVENSPVIGELRRLEADGVSILVCGTCLEHYGILAQKAVGETTNMLDVVTSMQLADKIIRI